MRGTESLDKTANETEAAGLTLGNPAHLPLNVALGMSPWNIQPIDINVQR